MQILRFAIGLSTSAALLAQLAPQPQFHPPDTVEFHNVDIYSEGTRMHGETFIAKDRAGQKRPCLVMAHGWGGTTANLRNDALAFAKAGYFVTSFHYRGWATSGARVVLTKPAPAPVSGGKFTAEVQEVRGVVDPVDMGTDCLNE